jgi:uncharacterized membrane protein
MCLRPARQEPTAVKPDSARPRTEAMRRAGFAVLLVVCFGVAGYGLWAYGSGPLGARVHPDMRASFEAHPVAIRTHVFASALALLLGPLQFSARLRSRHPHWHRWSGRIYLGVGVLVGGAAGLAMSVHAFGGLPGQLGFAGLALAWLATGALAFASIRRGDVAAHRRWMIRNFALSMAAVTLRIYLPSSFALGVPFDLAYPVIAWACWLPNLVVAERLALKATPGR